MSKVNPIPEGFHTVTPYLVIAGAEKAIEFYKKALGAEAVDVSKGPDGNIMNAQLRIGNSMVMLNDEFPDYGVKGPLHYGGTAVSMHLYVEDADASFNRAVEAGMEITMPLENMFWGDRYGQLKDPFGHSWSIASRVSAPSQEQMDKAMAEMFG